jgi:PadR family transcriptional regulator, regulatory protein PadR
MSKNSIDKNSIDVEVPESLSPKKESLLMVLYRHGQSGVYNLDLLNEIQAADVAVGRKAMALGTFYPTVKRLEEDGLISGFWEEREIVPGVRRRYLRITGSGVKALTTDRQYRAILSGESSDSRAFPVPVSGLPSQLVNEGGWYA